jgi:hypothetical protein
LALAWTLLHSLLLSDLKPIAAAAKTFSDAMTDLAAACGEISLIKLGDKLFTLISLVYTPVTSIGTHVSNFTSLYTSLKSVIAVTKVIQVDTTMAGIFFLKSFWNDDSLAALIQNLYDMKPFTFKKLAERMNIEDSRTDRVSGSLNIIAPNKGKFKSRNSKNFRSVVPTCGNPTPSSRSNCDGSRNLSYQSRLEDPEFDRMVDARIELLKKMRSQKLNSIKDTEEVECDAIEELEESDVENTGFFFEDDNNFHLGPMNLDDIRLILDTGASKSTVCDCRLLSDLQPIEEKMQTYSGSIDITHIGSMRFGKYKIHPVFLAPSRKCNLISVSQLEDHSFRMFHKNKLIFVCMGSTVVKRFPQTGDLYVSAGSSVSTAHTLFSVNEKNVQKDWHIILGHPSDIYVKKFLQLFNISSNDKTGSSVNCEVCKLAKLKRTSHKNSLPSATSPFKMIYMDVLQITPHSRGSFQYILVLIDNFSRYNCIYLMQKKNKAQVKIMSYTNEIKNQTDITPAVLHTDCGGEFGSTFLFQREISLEQGPANSPQTNGLAKRFNQTLLVKMCCMLAQCSVPLNYWDEAAKFASTLINMLPSAAINRKSPVSVLVNNCSTIEQVRHVQTLLPFGLKVYVHNQSPLSKLLPPSKPFLFLGYEPRSDALCFLDPLSCRVVISQDYTPSILSFPYNSTKGMIKLHSTLPTSCSSTEEYVTVSMPEDMSSSVRQSSSTPTPAFIPPTPVSRITPAPVARLARSIPSFNLHARRTASESPSCPHPRRTDSTSASSQPPPATKTHAWVLIDQPAPKNISSAVDPTNIVEGSRRRDKDLPYLLICVDDEFPELSLTESVTINKAMKDEAALPDWNEAMSSEFDSLQKQNTGILVPPPSDDKVIGGMWLLTRKKNEFNKVVCHKARWVVFGNHQEHMLHYFKTYSSVARNESLKMMLLLAVNHNLTVFQFDVATAFL